jgi:hypothetical protein
VIVYNFECGRVDEKEQMLKASVESEVESEAVVKWKWANQVSGAEG